MTLETTRVAARQRAGHSRLQQAWSIGVGLVLLTASVRAQNPSPVPSEGLSLWLRSDKGLVTSTTRVVTWEDQSPYHNDAHQYLAPKQPLLTGSIINGSPAVHFDGVADEMSLTLPISRITALTLFIVGTADQILPPDQDGAAVAPLFWASASSDRSDTVYSMPAAVGISPHVSASVRNGRTTQVYLDGVLVSSEAGRSLRMRGAWANATLGAFAEDGHFAGSIGEILVYNRVLSDIERSEVEQYMRDKYRIISASELNTTPRTSDVATASSDEQPASDVGMQVAYRSQSSTEVNVKQYGAKGDGSADDTAAIQKAIAAVPATNGSVYFPSGRYRYSGLTISGKSNLTVHGSGAILLETADLAGVAVSSAPGLTLSGLVFDHQHHSGYMLDISSPGIAISGCTFQNLGDGVNDTVQAALYVAPGSNNLNVQGSTFQNLTGGPSGVVRGIYVTNYRNPGTASTGLTIKKNSFKTLTPSVDADAIVIDQQTFSTGAVIASNEFYNSSKRAVKLMSNGNTVKNNTITVDNLKVQSFAAVSSYGDDNVIASNTATAQGCNSGCSFYAGWELSGNNNVLTDNTLTNPPTTSDKDIDCINIDLQSDTNGHLAFDHIQIARNSCKTFRFARVYKNTPMTNLSISDNTFSGMIYSYAVTFYPGSTINGLNFSGNATTPGGELVYFQSAGAGGKANVNIGTNTGTIDLNLGNDPVPSSFNVQTPLAPVGGISVYSIVSGQKFASGSVMPNAAYWRLGDMIYNMAAAADKSTGWKCVQAGAPGGWLAFKP